MDALGMAVLAWVAGWSTVAFVLAGVDKRRARRRRRRIPERTLLGTAALGGTPGLVLGMSVFRHKTRKTAFLVPLAAVVALQVAVLWFIWSRS